MPATLLLRVRRIMDHDLSTTVAISIGVVAALLWSTLDAGSYQRIVNTSWSSGFLQQVSLSSVHAVVINLAMTIFFFAIGLELARELRSLSRSAASKLVPPILGALGGMVATALLSILVGVITNSHVLRRGWGVPMATDIAFTLGILALVGRRLPRSVRLFLLTLAVADDAFSVVVLALTGGAHHRVLGLVALAVMIVIGVFVAGRQPRVGWSLVILAGLWICFVAANVEPPLAGVIGGLLVPAKHPSTLKLETSMTRWSSGLVLPLFALVSCGIRWHQLTSHTGTLSLVVSLVVIRILGKVLGITGGVSLARALRYPLDESISWPVLFGVSILCAIGFTVPLLFVDVLFGAQGTTYYAFTAGLLVASLVAALLGTIVLRIANRSA